jgi:thiamine-phosphate diphosphorylase
VIPRLHLVTDDSILARDGFASRARSVLQAGGSGVALHIRGPRTDGGRIFDLARTLQDTAAEEGGLLLVNDRLDVALSLDLPGAHLGQRSLPPSVARSLLGPHRTLGLSVHGPQEAREGEREGVDYLVVGAIFPTPSHPDQTPGGMELLRGTQAVTSLPLLAIGGITVDRIKGLLAEGTYGVAVRGGVWDQLDPGAAVQGYLREMDSDREGAA